jgi:hypothetical protein
MTPASGLQIDGHLVLVGLPGSGKSTVGRAVASRLSRPFLDFDAELERRVGTSVARMFAEEGEVAAGIGVDAGAGGGPADAARTGRGLGHHPRGHVPPAPPGAYYPLGHFA